MTNQNTYYKIEETNLLNNNLKIDFDTSYTTTTCTRVLFRDVCTDKKTYYVDSYNDVSNKIDNNQTYIPYIIRQDLEIAGLYFKIFE